MSFIAISWVNNLLVGNAPAKAILLFFATHNFPKPGFYFKLETIVKKTEYSIATVKRSIRLLEDKKLIMKEERYDDTGRQLTNCYYLNIPDDYISKMMGEEVINTSKNAHVEITVNPQGGSHRTPRGITVNPPPSKKRSNSKLKSSSYKVVHESNSNIKTNSNINNNLKNICATDVAQDRFEEFWSIYRKKKNKSRANQVWLKKKCNEHADEIIDKVKLQNQFERQWQQEQYIPMPDKYLTRELWNDDIDDNRITTQPNKSKTHSMGYLPDSYFSKTYNSQGDLDGGDFDV